MAGAGTGSGPCWVRTRPDPSGSAETVQRVAPIASIRWAAATMSAIESQAPTSWNATASTGMPCTRASASARCPKIARAWASRAGGSPLASRSRRIADQCRCAWWPP